MKHFKYILLLLPLLYYSCNDDILQDLDSVAAQNEEQDARIDSLLTIILDQQAYIDSLNNAQHVADSLDNLTLQAYIDSLINAGKVYVDSLITVQNTNNATQQALLDAQQATLTALANSSLSAGFVETEVFSAASLPSYPTWLDIDLSSVVGQKQSLVLIKASMDSGSGGLLIRPNGSTSDYHDTDYSDKGGSGVNYVYLSDYQNTSKYLFIYTDNNGLIEARKAYSHNNNNPIYRLSVVFYLSQ